MNSGAELAGFAAGLRFEHIPADVIRKTEDLLVDWFASAVAGHGSRPGSSRACFVIAGLLCHCGLDPQSSVFR